MGVIESEPYICYHVLYEDSVLLYLILALKLNLSDWIVFEVYFEDHGEK